MKSLLLVAAATLFVQHALPASATTCATAWSATAVYTGGQAASLASTNYTANWWTQGQSPATNSGGSGSGQPWTSTGACTAASSGSGSSGSGSGSGSSGSGSGSSSSSTATTNLFAPYVDMSLTASQNLVATQQQTAFKAVTLAFLDSTSGCAAGWGGLGSTLPADTLSNGTTILSVVQSLQKAGVQVIISFGGANGQEPALGCTTVSSLQALYQSVINRYGVAMLDFDIEGAATTNQASITRRDQALVALKAANKGLVLSYTLPVLPTGLISSGTNILASAKSDGLALDVVNIMAMDYGSNADNNGAMGQDAVDAAQATEAQLKSAGLSATTVGITPMIGVNDTTSEVFTLADAQTLLNFANSTSYVTRLAMWSLGRDNGSCAGTTTYPSPTCSGISETGYQFTDNLKTFK